MKPRPKTPEEAGDYDALCNALAEHIEQYWEGKLLPKGWAALRGHYKDFDGINEWEGSKKQARAINEFGSFDDSSACSPHFVDRVSLPHVMYDDTNQGRNPLRVLIGACVTHGARFGELHAQFKAEQDVADRISWGLHRLYRQTTDREKLAAKLTKFVYEVKAGLHRQGCNCYACRVPKGRPITKKQQAMLRKKVLRALTTKKKG